ncbi:MAG: phage holin family protein [Desulfobacteraceae bacterium]
MDEFRSVLKIMLEMLPAILLALLGGIVRMVNKKETITFCFVLGGLFSSAFVAIIVSLLLSGVEIPKCTQMAMVGMSGYSSSEILGILKSKILKKIGGIDGKKSS